MSKDEALKLALEALFETTALCVNYKSVEDPDGYRFEEADEVIKQGWEAMDAVRKALEDTSDAEPVAKVCHDLPQHVGWNPKITHLPDEGTPLYTSAPVTSDEPIGEVQIEELDIPFTAGKVALHFYNEQPPIGTKLYAAPPNRIWQGLTDKEIESCPSWCGDQHDFARELEAKLKKRNT